MNGHSEKNCSVEFIKYSTIIMICSVSGIKFWNIDDLL